MLRAGRDSNYLLEADEGSGAPRRAETFLPRSRKSYGPWKLRIIPGEKCAGAFAAHAHRRTAAEDVGDPRNAEHIG